MSKKKKSRNQTAAASSTPQSTPIASLQVFALGFESVFGLLAFLSLCGLLLIAPYLFSGFWPSSYEYWPQGLFLALTACTCVLLALSLRSKIKNQRSNTGVLLALFFTWCAISVFGTVYLHDSLLEIARVTGVVAWFYITRALLLEPEYFRSRVTWLLLCIASGTVIVCIVGIVQYFNRPDRIFSTFYNPNLLANYCAMAIPLSIAGVLMLWRSSRRESTPLTPGAVLFLGGAAIAIIASGLFLTSSKGGFLATICGLLIFAIAIFKAKGEAAKEVIRARRGAVAIIALLLVIGGGVLFSRTILPRLSSNIENDHSTMFRYYTWRGTLRMAAARPILGFGPGSFPSAYTQFAETGYTRTAHQQWLQLATESGFPAMLLLLAACGLSTLNAWRALKTSNWIFAAGALGAITAFFVHGLTDAGWSIISIATLAMIVLSIAECGVRSADPTSNQSEIQNPKSEINWLWLLAALPLALGSWITQRAQQGEDLRAESRELMARGAVNTALERARQAAYSDWSSSRLITNFAQATEAAGQSSVGQYSIAWLRQPSRALNHLNLATYYANSNDRKTEAKRWFDSAVKFDPNDTDIRMSRGKWKLDNNDPTGWQDIEYIAALKDKPYGKYPATPEMVDLNFARAFTMLAERDVKRNPTAAKKWIARGLEVIAEAREHESRRRELEQAVYGSIDYSREKAMDELEAKLNSLQEKLQ